MPRQVREVSMLIDKNLDAGYHSVVWDANSYERGVFCKDGSRRVC